MPPRFRSVGSDTVLGTDLEKPDGTAEEVFSRKRAATADVFGGGPVYLLVDRAAADAPAVQLPESQRVFSNPRVELFRLPGGKEPLTTASVSQ